MDSEDDLDILTALLTESEDVGREDQGGQEPADDLDGLFDDENDEEEYEDGVKEEVRDAGTEDAVSDLYGDVGDMEEEQTETEEKVEARSNDDLQEELRKMQQQMQRLQQQLEATQKVSTPSSTPSTPVRTAGSSAVARHMSPKATPQTKLTSKVTMVKPGAPSPKTKIQTSPASSSTPARSGNTKVQESTDFFEQLNNADSFKRKPRVAHQAKPSTSPEDRGPLVEIKLGSTFQPVEKVSPPASLTKPAPAAPSKPPSLPALPKDVGVERYSGLRLRKPRVSSTEMDQKMSSRRLIRLSQVPERLTRENLEDSDWVTFAVVLSKATPQSSTSGKTFSIWKLNDLHNLEVVVSLLLFGDVHKEHWKTEVGTVIGILNPNLMKPKDGYDGVSLTVDHPQKVLLMGESQDFSTCKAMKKNGDPCSQIVNMYDCQYCQYHVKAQYKKMSSKRAELQSSYSGKAPNKMKGKNGSLKERLCQDGFHYGGVSSAACAASLTASKPKKSTQGTLDKLFVKGSAQILDQAKRLALQSGEVSGCSNEFKSLMSVPTPGALQLKKHLVKGNQSVSKDVTGSPVQSITASDLLKHQKQKQREFLNNRRRRADEIQKKVLQNSGGPKLAGSLSSMGKEGLMSPKTASQVPKSTQSPAAPHTPTLARGFSEGEDILFFERSPPSAPAPRALSLSTAKLAALKKLRGKNMKLEKEDPNAVKRKRSNDDEISTRVEKNLTSPTGESSKKEEPAQKKKRDELRYMESEEFQKILNAKSRHGIVLQAAEYQLQERYFDPLVKKEQMEEKMRGVREMKCRAVTCTKCSYTYFKPADRCVEENHNLRWHDALKRFFKCPCGQRAIALDRLPNQNCSNCGLFKWERDGMLKEKTGPKIGGELLQPRGEEHAKFLSSMK
ncbi:MCM10-like isoform X1 [Solea senegalensis]|uniref:Protein MCM10 homolog n=1 Tax=Solea senegalensis TaxID=28829 RepID=A0AAV6QW01_SOLSE|nr:protein MCM10 homolog isoform X1 [Solea senegalensis]KAG7497288.1 MCM10-like isoform X1 [Solea senegalensis]